jgi:hypothetical protein
MLVGNTHEFLRSSRLTSDGTCATTTSVVVHNNRIALDNAIHGEIATVACVGDLAILEAFDGDFHSVNGRSSGLQDVHGQSRGAEYH